MAQYDFEVLEGDETIASVRSVDLPNPKALWSWMAELARKVYAPGRTIRVANPLGEIVILIGVAAAIRAVSSLSPQPPRLAPRDKKQSGETRFEKPTGSGAVVSA